MTTRRFTFPLAALLALGLAVAPVAPASACACGGVAPSPGSEVSVGEEHAIVSWDGETQQIDMLLGVLSSATETGLVVPTPSPATVSLGDRADFDAIDRVTTPRRVEELDWWTFRGLGDGASAGAPPEVLDRVQLGPIEAVTLAATDTAGLEAWLAENAFELSPEVTALLDGYVERGWYFVALKLTGDAPLDGGLEPLRFTFASDELVYPLERSRAATSPQTVRLFVFSEHRQVVSFGGSGEPGFTSWASPVTGTEVESFGDYLTVFELYFSDPATQVLGDLSFRDALSDQATGTEYRVTVPVGILGIPLGWILSAFALLVLLGAAVVVTVVRAKRT